MSDSEDSESFLSADEGDAGNVSSDITLSSDSEPEEKEKAVTGGAGHESSDITLSSDEDESPVQSAKGTTQDKKVGRAGSNEETKTKTKLVASRHEKEQLSSGIGKHAEEDSSSKVQSGEAAKTFEVSCMSHTLSKVTNVETEKQTVEKATGSLVQMHGTNDVPKCTETAALMTSTACIASSAPPDGYNTSPKDPDGTCKAALPAQEQADAEGWGDLGETTLPGEEKAEPEGWGDPGEATSPCEEIADSEGWGDLGETTSPGEEIPEPKGGRGRGDPLVGASPEPEAPREQDDWGWTDDRTSPGPTQDVTVPVSKAKASAGSAPSSAHVSVTSDELVTDAPDNTAAEDRPTDAAAEARPEKAAAADAPERRP
ncbi:smoothelin-like protein 1 [Pollicipes pollicipes]|uniref:smoothelin-like protein 1 n=1 Tax=Pollicipes pollicipes TaxID=41117 RepID=UPI00188552CA|nr:smoothelin-like protein 1 [Pollicipes pollicipes]